MDIKKLIETVTGDLDDKRRWRDSMARLKALPDGYRRAADAVKRYLNATGAGGASGGSWSALYEDLADLFEQAAAARTPIRELIGDDPAAFAEEFASNYPEHRWIDAERRKLTESITRAEREQHDDATGADAEEHR
jgi:DNA-binding ferritin-like protein (Dps family)